MSGLPDVLPRTEDLLRRRRIRRQESFGSDVGTVCKSHGDFRHTILPLGGGGDGGRTLWFGSQFVSGSGSLLRKTQTVIVGCTELPETTTIWFTCGQNE